MFITLIQGRRTTQIDFLQQNEQQPQQQQQSNSLRRSQPQQQQSSNSLQRPVERNGTHGSEQPSNTSSFGRPHRQQQQQQQQQQQPRGNW